MRVAFWMSYFPITDPERKLEIDTCFRINAENPVVDVFYILVENDAELPIESTKIVKIPIRERPKYSTFFNLYRVHESPDTINVLLNSDIVIDYRHTGWLDNISEKMLFAITRYEIIGDAVPTTMYELSKVRVELCESIIQGSKWLKNQEYHSSQDVWAIRGYPPNIHLFEFELGVPKCDGRVAFLFRCSDYKVYNPCLTIYCYHYHRSPSRNYKTPIAGDTAWILPTNIAALCSPEHDQTIRCVYTSPKMKLPPY
jgi:hypothetical protein